MKRIVTIVLLALAVAAAPAAAQHAQIESLISAVQRLTATEQALRSTGKLTCDRRDVACLGELTDRQIALNWLIDATIEFLDLVAPSRNEPSADSVDGYPDLINALDRVTAAVEQLTDLIKLQNLKDDGNGGRGIGEVT